MIGMGDVRMSWRAFRQAPYENGPESLMLQAAVVGSVPGAEIGDRLEEDMGEFRGMVSINLTKKTAFVSVGTALDSAKLAGN